jgi:hypothetical protein
MKTAKYFRDGLRALEDELSNNFDYVRRNNPVIDFTKLHNFPVPDFQENFEGFQAEVWDQGLCETLPIVEYRNDLGYVQDVYVLRISNNGLDVMLAEHMDRVDTIGFHDLADISDRIEVYSEALEVIK